MIEVPVNRLAALTESLYKFTVAVESTFLNVNATFCNLTLFPAAVTEKFISLVCEAVVEVAATVAKPLTIL